MNTADSAPPKALHPLQILLFVCTRMVMNINGRIVYPFLAVFARGLGVDVQSLSLALTARSLVATANPLVVNFADRYGRKPVILLGVGTAAGCAALMILWPGYPSFFIFLCLTYLSIYVTMPALQAFVGDLVPYERRGRVMALMELGWALSFIVGMPAAAFLIQRWGWRAPFPVLAVIELALFLLLLRTLPRGFSNPSGQRAPASGLKIIKLVFTTPSALAGLALNLAAAGAAEMVMLVFGLWMEDTFALKLTGLGFVSAAIGISELGGEGLSALLVDRLGKKRSITIGMVVCGLAALALPWLDFSLLAAVAGLGLFYMSYEFAFVSTMPLLSEVIPEARATVMGSNLAAVAAGRALSALIAPTLFYTFGFAANAVASSILAVAMLVALRKVKTVRA